ncbi:replication initiator protein [Apis mellifera associated microvirus 52]|nr:replication initiator protein [Apis mellifera associated microvirus 52]
MLCKNPFVHGVSGLVFPCGQCFPCLLKRRKLWSNRIMLESYKHAKNAFVTLTYSEENEPEGGTLVVADLQKFYKRLRKKISPEKIRHYSTGEYGENNHRPHYHAAIFGLGPEDAETIDTAWGLGYTFTGELTPDSAQYVAGYLTKDICDRDDPFFEDHLYPFSRMSLRPGIGADAMTDVMDVLTSPAGCDALSRAADVPDHLLDGKSKIVLGRYLRGKLREKLGFPDKKITPEALALWKEEMSQLRKDAFAEKGISPQRTGDLQFKYWYAEKNAQKVLQLETKNKIFSARKKI